MKRSVSLLFCAILFFLGSCGGGSLSEKIQEGKDLLGEDYSEMVGYMYEAMSEMEEINRTAGPSDYKSLMADIREITQDYPMVPVFYDVCLKAMNSDSKNFNKKTVNLQKFGRVMDFMCRCWGKFW